LTPLENNPIHSSSSHSSNAAGVDLTPIGEGRLLGRKVSRSILDAEQLMGQWQYKPEEMTPDKHSKSLFAWGTLMFDIRDRPKWRERFRETPRTSLSYSYTDEDRAQVTEEYRLEDWVDDWFDKYDLKTKDPTDGEMKQQPQTAAAVDTATKKLFKTPPLENNPIHSSSSLSSNAAGVDLTPIGEGRLLGRKVSRSILDAEQLMGQWQYKPEEMTPDKHSKSLFAWFILMCDIRDREKLRERFRETPRTSRSCSYTDEDRAQVTGKSRPDDWIADFFDEYDLKTDDPADGESPPTTPTYTNKDRAGVIEEYRLDDWVDDWFDKYASKTDKPTDGE